VSLEEDADAPEERRGVGLMARMLLLVILYKRSNLLFFSTCNEKHAMMAMMAMMRL